MAADNLRFTMDGRTYRWVGGYGAVFTSYERGVRPGDTRVINGTLFSARRVGAQMFGPHISRAAISWVFAPDRPSEDLNDAIRQFQYRVFGA